MRPYYSDNDCVIWHADCRDVLADLEVVDCIITDPPYGIPQGAAFKRGSRISDEGDARHNKSVAGWRELADVSDGGYIVEFCRRHPEALEMIFAEHRKAGWTPWHTFAFVKESTIGWTPRPNLISAWELAIISYVGKRNWYGDNRTADRWIGRTPNQLRKGLHPTEKPIELMSILVQTFTEQSHIIVDPFCGSGSTLRAAKDSGRYSVGIEIEEKYCEIAANRMSQENLFRVEGVNDERTRSL